MFNVLFIKESDRALLEDFNTSNNRWKPATQFFSFWLLNSKRTQQLRACY